jgi:acetyl-CoA carboxylase biotin carboxyl carrier protein
MIDLDWIRSLIDMVDGSGIDSLEISRFGTRVRLSKSPPMMVGAAVPRAEPALSAPPPAPPPPEAAPSENPTSGGPEPQSNLVEVTSPMVGTFYRSPAPDAPPYVEIGDRVQKGQTLCILEAMKLMNELEAEVSGIVREICVENADPVEFGQVLFRIDPS